MDPRYVLVNTSDKDNLDFSKLLNDENNCPESYDGNLILVYYNTPEKPSELSGYTDYNKNEIMEILRDPNSAWTPDRDTLQADLARASEGCLHPGDEGWPH